MSEHEGTSVWKSFWERGGWWKALIVAAVYYAVYQFLPLAIAPILVPLLAGPTDTQTIVAGYAVPVAIGAAVLVAFALSIGWLKELFARQPIRGGAWMWIAVAVVLVFNIARFATIDYGKAGFGFVAAWMLAGLFIGFAEEFLTRGIVVNLMRKAGHPEIAVALVSAGIFAALHSGNLLTGQALVPTLLQLVYTFGFGICMYLALRVTGNLIWPILLHASTDPSIFMQTTFPAPGALTAIASLGNFPVIAFGLIAIFFIRGRVGATKADALS